MATYFWIGTSGGTWDSSTTTNWAASSGGGGGAGVPGAADTAIFDGNSGANTITTSGSIVITTLTLNTGFTGTVTFGAAFTASGLVTLTQGTLNTNGQTCSWGTFSSINSASTCVLNLGASTVTLTTVGSIPWETAGSHLTVNAGTSTIQTPSGVGTSNALYYFGSFTYNNVIIYCNSNAPRILGGTLANLSVIVQSGSNCGLNLTTGNPATTVTGSLTLTGLAAPNRLLFASSVFGAACTITAATTAITYCDFQDITGAGAGNWSTPDASGWGNCGGNSGITFTTTQTNYYCATANANWSVAGNWYLATGGTGGAGRVPFPQDTAIFDGSSGVHTYTLDTPRFGTMTATGFTGTLAVNTSGGTITCYGSWTSPTTLTFPTGNFITFSGRSTYTITPASGNSFHPVTINAPGGTYTFGAGISIGTNAGIIVTNGTLNLGSFTHSIGNFTLNGASGTANLQSCTLNLNWTGSVWQYSAGTLSAGTSTIKITDVGSTAKTFQGGGKSFNIVQIIPGGTGAVIITGANTFANITCIGGSKTITFPSSTTQTISTAAGFNISGISGGLVTINASTVGTAATISVASGTVTGNYLSLQDNTASGGATFNAYNSTIVSNVSGWTLSGTVWYWTGAVGSGTGTWDGSTTTNWATTSGGAGGAGVPAAGDTVVFDSNSGTGTVTIATGQTCGSLICDGSGSGASGSYAGTLATAAGLTTAGAVGSLNFVAGMTVTGTTALSFTGTGTLNVKSGGLTLPGFTVNASGLTTLLQSSYTTSATATVTLTQGTLNTNGQTCSWGTFASGSASIRTLTLGTSAITITGNVTGEGWQITSSNLTVTSNTAVVTLTANSVSLNLGTSTNYNGMSIVISANGSVGYGVSTAGHIIANLTYAPATAAVGNSFNVQNIFTVTNSITFTGAAAPNVPFVDSSVVGTSRTITCNGTATLSGRMDFQDIAGAGTATWNFATSGGDCQGNSGITFATPQTNYWVGSTGNVSASTWATSSGGTSGSGRSPFPQDTAILDNNSGTGNVTLDTSRIGTVNLTGFTGTLTTTNPVCYGGLTCTNTTTYAVSGVTGWTFQGRSSYTVTGSAGHTAASPFNQGISFNAPGGTYSLVGTFILAISRGFVMIRGTVNCGSVSVPSTSGILFSNTGSAAVLNLQTSSWIMTNSINFQVAATLSCGSATISVSAVTVFTGSTVTLGTSQWTLTGTGTVWTGASTITDGGSSITISDTSSTAKTFAGGGQSYGTLQITPGGTGAVIISGANTFANITCIGGSKTITLTSSTTQTISTAAGFNISGLSGSPVTINASTAGTAATISVASGTVNASYVSLQDNTASGGATFKAYNSTIVSNVTGWTLSGHVWFWTGAVGSGTGTWDGSTTTNWSTTTGGSGSAGVPAAGDTVVFDANSGTGTVTTATGQTCGTMICDGSGSGASGTYAGTLAIATTFAVAGVAGSLNFTSGMTVTGTSVLTFTCTGTLNVKTGGLTLPGFTVNAGTLTTILQSSYTTAVSSSVTLAQGTLNTNNQTCSWGTFISSSSSVRTLTLGSSAITITGNVSGEGWQGASTNFAVTANTAVATFTAQNVTIALGAVNYNGMSVVVTAPFNPTIASSTGCAIANFTYSPATPATSNSLTLSTNFTVTNTITFTGSAAPNIPAVLSSPVGTSRTITCNGTVTQTARMDFQDIVGAGTATWNLATYGGDCLGNSGITFATPQTNYWVGNTANWSITTAWASSSGGSAGSGRVPFPQDGVTFDANSFTSSGRVVTLDTIRWGANVNFAAVSNNPQLTGSLQCSVFGSLTFGTMTRSGWSQGVVLASRSSSTITTAGFAMPAVAVNAYSGTYTLQDTYTGATQGLTITYGTFVTNNHNMTLALISSSNSNTRALTLGTSTVTLTSTGQVWNCATVTGFTLSAASSTIVITDTSTVAKSFGGGGLTYGTLQIASGGKSSVTVSGANTFASIAAGPQTQLIFPSSTTQTLTSATGWRVSGSDYGYQFFPAVSGNYASTPDAAPLDITGDIDLRVWISLASWTQGSNALIGKWGSLTTKCYLFYLNSSGVLSFSTTTDGATTQTATCSTTLSLTANQITWLRVTRQQSSGNVIFYTSPDGVTWTPVGTTQVLLAGTALYNTASIVEVGTSTAGITNNLIGNVYRAQIYNGIGGTLVFDANFTSKPVGANTFTESSTNAATVTINGAAAQAGDGRVLIAASTPGTAATVSVASGTVQSNYLSLQDSTATGGATFYAGANSANISNNTGWNFSNATTGGSSLPLTGVG
jgi:hypothetical protein